MAIDIVKGYKDIVRRIIDARETLVEKRDASTNEGAITLTCEEVYEAVDLFDDLLHVAADLNGPKSAEKFFRDLRRELKNEAADHGKD